MSNEHITPNQINIQTQTCQTVLNNDDPRLSQLIPFLDQNIYISGIGGTGKSYLLKQIYDFLKEKKRKVVLTSTTGVSAYNIQAVTTHSWSGIILPSHIPEDVNQFLKRVCDKILKSIKFRVRWKNIEYILIDEISMLGANYIEVFDTVAKHIRKNNQPFGGIKLICSGDMLQLPPVNDEFCFKSPVWDELDFVYINLQKAFRFDNQDWVDILARVRVGKMTKRDLDVFRECHEKYLKSKNDRSKTLKINPTIIHSLRKDVESINNQELQKLNSIKTQEYSCLDEYYNKDNDMIKFSCSKQQKDLIDNELNIPQKLVLKIGAQVMLTANIDVQNGLANGSRGVIVDLDESSVTVKLVNDSVHKIFHYDFAIDAEPYVLVRKMIPLDLAFSTTIHKSQGSSLDCVLIDCGQKIFEAGQAYVALSRCRSLSGLYIEGFIPSKVYPNKEALEFEEYMLKKAMKIE